MLTTDHAIATEAAMGAISARLGQTPQPVTLCDRLRWRAAKARKSGAFDLAKGLEQDADTVAQMQQSLIDTRIFLAERDATIRRLNNVIRALGGESQ